MIAELIRALRQSRRDQESLQQRLDALLRRAYAPRPSDPQQPLLFAPPEEVSAPPASPASPLTSSPRAALMKKLPRRMVANAAAFSMFPTTMEQLIAVADAGLMMPPKSTWFEPKLRSGLLVHMLD
jgi:hypothetical protein